MTESKAMNFSYFVAERRAVDKKLKQVDKNKISHLKTLEREGKLLHLLVAIDDMVTLKNRIFHPELNLNMKKERDQLVGILSIDKSLSINKLRKIIASADNHKKSEKNIREQHRAELALADYYYCLAEKINVANIKVKKPSGGVKQYLMNLINSFLRRKKIHNNYETISPLAIGVTKEDVKSQLFAQAANYFSKSDLGDNYVLRARAAGAFFAAKEYEQALKHYLHLAVGGCFELQIPSTKGFDKSPAGNTLVLSGLLDCIYNQSNQQLITVSRGSYKSNRSSSKYVVDALLADKDTLVKIKKVLGSLIRSQKTIDSYRYEFAKKILSVINWRQNELSKTHSHENLKVDKIRDLKQENKLKLSASSSHVMDDKRNQPSLPLSY